MWLSCVTAIVSLAVGSSNVSTGSNKIPAPAITSGNTIVINANQDSHSVEKAIKSLETTLEKNFQQLIRVVNATNFGGNRPYKPGN